MLKQKYFGTFSEAARISIKRFAIEALVILALSLGWAYFRVPDISGKGGDFLEQVGHAFFFISYFYNYFGRVRKLADDKEKHRDLLGKQQLLVDQLAAASRDLVGHANGGDSFCYLSMSDLKNGVFTGLFVMHQGKYPIPDVSVNISNLDLLHEKLQKIQSTNNIEEFWRGDLKLQLGTVFPNLAVRQPHTFSTSPGELKSRIRLQLNWLARNGAWIQWIQFELVNEEWEHATKIDRDGREIMSSSSPAYPVDENGKAIFTKELLA
jgi:hypothetical protein